MGPIMKLLVGIFGVEFTQEVNYYAETHHTVYGSTQQTTVNAQKATSRQTTSGAQRNTSSQQPDSGTTKTAQSPAVTTQPILVKEPDDLGTLELPRPDDVGWLSDSRKVAVAISVLERDGGNMSYYWDAYYLKRESVEEITSRQEQDCYDHFWHIIRACWKMLNHPFWAAYVAGHFPSPQAVKGRPELVKEICVLDVKELKSRQSNSLIKDGVYTLGLLQNSLFNDRWQPVSISSRDKWYFRKVLTQYGIETPPSDEPDPIPFAELYIGAVFGVKVTPEKRLSSYGFIQGDESLESRIKRIRDDGLVYDFYIERCEDAMFYLHPVDDERRLEIALHDARRNLKARKILAGGNYPEMRSSAGEGVDLEELEKFLVKGLLLSQRAKRRAREFFCDDEITLADLVRIYHDRLLNENSPAATELREYLYEHGYVIRPENMPMDERTPVAYLRLPTRIRDALHYPARVETIDDLVRCCSGNDLVFSLREADGIGKRSMETIRARLVELGFLTDSE